MVFLFTFSAQHGSQGTALRAAQQIFAGSIISRGSYFTLNKKVRNCCITYLTIIISGMRASDGKKRKETSKVIKIWVLSDGTLSKKLELNS